MTIAELLLDLSVLLEQVVRLSAENAALRRQVAELRVLNHISKVRVTWAT